MKGYDADNRPVVSETVSEFAQISTAEPIENWRNWIELFTKKIEENCNIGSNRNIDPKNPRPSHST